LDLFEDNRIPVQDAKIVLWTLLTDIYEDELIQEPQRRETIMENIERQNERLMVYESIAAMMYLAYSTLGGSVLQYQTARGYDSVVMIAAIANSISSAFLDPFCLLLANNVTFYVPAITLLFRNKGA